MQRLKRLFPRTLLRHSRAAQILLLGAFWLLGEALVGATGVPVPGSIIGLCLVLALLMGGFLRPASLRRGAHLLLSDMLLFFVPAVLAVLEHREFLGIVGLKILVVIFFGILLVMTGTALTVDLCYRLTVRHDKR